MRVTGGELLGRRLFCPRGPRVRPTTDRVREALFQVVLTNFFDDLVGLRVLDLFSGTGALGIEALSRGVAHCTFVDNSFFSLNTLKKNLENLGLLNRARIIKKDAYKFLEVARRQGETFDLVFCDPPYERGHFKRILEFFIENPGLLFRDGLLIIEERKTVDLSTDKLKALELVKVKRYGDTKLFFIKGDKGKNSNGEKGSLSRDL